MSSRVTQKDIAGKLKLSQSLVANVLNGRSDIWVSAENRRRILETAREMNYSPNAAARALRRGKTRTVGCVFFRRAGDDYVIERLTSSLIEIGYDLIVKLIIRPEEALQRVQLLASDGLCDVMVLWGTEADVEETGMFLAHSQVPFVVKGRFKDTHPDWLQVSLDHEGMMRQAVEHLTQRGHRRIAYMGYDTQMLYAQRRVDGFRTAIENCLGQTTVRDDFLGRIEFTPESVTDLIAYWMALPEAERPTGLVMGVGQSPWNDIETWFVKRGQRIGDTGQPLAVCGLGGPAQSLLFGDAYTYSGHNEADVAELMARSVLIPLLKGEKPPTITQLLLPLLPCYTLGIPVCSAG